MRLATYIRSFADELQKIAELDPEYAGFISFPTPPPLPPMVLLQLLQAPKADFYDWLYRRRYRGRDAPAYTTWPAT